MTPRQGFERLGGAIRDDVLADDLKPLMDVHLLATTVTL
jgi:hypothetical protein